MGNHIHAVTGHRPDKIGGYSEEALETLVQFALRVVPRFLPDTIITGMALGFDTAVALACIELGLPYIAAVPFKDQESQWPKDSQVRYNYLIKKADRVVVVSKGGFLASKMQIRNEYMVDSAECLLALWNGSSGGTANCIRYAKEQKKLVHNYWLEWEVFSKCQ